MILTASKNSSPVLYLPRTLTAVATIHIGRVLREFCNTFTCRKYIFIHISQWKVSKCHFVWKRLIFCFWFVCNVHALIYCDSLCGSEGRGSMSFCNTHTFIQEYMVSQCHEPLPREPQTSHPHRSAVNLCGRTAFHSQSKSALFNAAQVDHRLPLDR